jgi:hypothetical protein
MVFHNFPLAGYEYHAQESFCRHIFDKLGDKLCTAIRDGLAKNSTLEKLSLDDIIQKTVQTDDDGALSARKPLSFLRTNSTLKSLTVSFVPTETFSETHISAFRLQALKMLENTFIESLAFQSADCAGCARGKGTRVKVEEFFALSSALQLNTTLKTLGLRYNHLENIELTDEEVNQLVCILRKNYGLEHLVPDIACADGRTVKAILRLSGAGRRYLIEDGSSISKGVDV